MILCGCGRRRFLEGEKGVREEGREKGKRMGRGLPRSSLALSSRTASL